MFFSGCGAPTGLLAGMWEFPSLLLDEENSKVKQKGALCAEVGRILGVEVNKDLLSYVGEVSAIQSPRLHIPSLTTELNLRFFFILLVSCFRQVVHIFSHIHQTYIVYSVSVEDEHATEETQSEKLQWLTRPALLEAAVSTGLKKVCLHHCYISYRSTRITFLLESNELLLPFK